MKHIFHKTILIALLIMSVLLLPLPVQARSEAGTSAALLSAPKSATAENVLLKRLVIKEVLERYNSPLIADVDSFMKTCTAHELDCYLLPSISGVESTFGKFLMPDSHNPFGWGGGHIYFDTYEDGIEAVGSGLRNNYINRGAHSIDEIGAIYAGSKTWPTKVKFFLGVFEQAEAEKRMHFSQLAVEL
ncbi:MAG: hypothetical protein ACEQSA_01930 [Weeksellaceae bacterium]